MAAPYIPPRDGDFEQFLRNFSTLIDADPAAYGLSSAEAAIISAAYAAWHGAYVLAVEPSTRTRPAVRGKDVQRAAATAVVRRYAALIRPDESVSSALKIGLGLRPPARTHARIAAPTVVPLLTVVHFNVGRHTVRALGEGGTGRRAKPANAVGLLVFRITADAAVTAPAGAEFVGFITRGVFESIFTQRDSGKTATYFARWTNAKGQLGPWSAPSSMRIAA